MQIIEQQPRCIVTVAHIERRRPPAFADDQLRLQPAFAARQILTRDRIQLIDRHMPAHQLRRGDCRGVAVQIDHVADDQIVDEGLMGHSMRPALQQRPRRLNQRPNVLGDRIKRQIRALQSPSRQMRSDHPIQLIRRQRLILQSRAIQIGQIHRLLAHGDLQRAGHLHRTPPQTTADNVGSDAREGLQFLWQCRIGHVGDHRLMPPAGCNGSHLRRYEASFWIVSPSTGHAPSCEAT